MTIGRANICGGYSSPTRLTAPTTFGPFSSDQSVPREAHTTSGFVDFIERLLSGFRQALIDRTHIRMRREANSMLLLKRRDDCSPIHRAGRASACADMIG
ncbi:MULTISPECIES: hypothetical protein [unclassified Bradyrhizobium]|uniref:hypothetical protein n=1 Tax=unclassified Bradyrhizobium TaxID=2631580 RepID=UPI001FFAE015|nr:MULTISPECIES: hypothetical protein [unclassified Bradyrhizobium]MCK1711958.1 hypothetical protein [Bradyrhizobium sp. 143]MCK1727218.1 hypothetical protein [Bradyrhizobium sp. 142]